MCILIIYACVIMCTAHYAGSNMFYTVKRIHVHVLNGYNVLTATQCFYLKKYVYDIFIYLHYKWNQISVQVLRRLSRSCKVWSNVLEKPWQRILTRDIKLGNREEFSSIYKVMPYYGCSILKVFFWLKRKIIIFLVVLE